MKPSEIALRAAELYASNTHVWNCCHALLKAENVPCDSQDPNSVWKRFQREFAERTWINVDGAIDDMTEAEIDQFRVFLLLFFAEWLKDRGE